MKRSTLLLFFTLPIFFITQGQKSFKLVLLPDTQNYSEKYPEIFKAQTDWIAARSDSFKFVLQQGDLTQNHDDKEFQRAAGFMGVLDGKVPYTIAIGNHDMGSPGKVSDIRDTDLFNKYFPYNKFSKLSSFGGSYEVGKMDNVWFKFKAGRSSKWLILNLEFGPRDKVLKWAANVIATHSNYKVIINTHAYLYSDNKHFGADTSHKWLPQEYGIGKDSGENSINNGKQMWDKLVSRYPNILLVFCGHVCNTGVGKLISVGQNGNKVYQMLANYQKEVEGSDNGRTGFLRIVTVDIKQNKIAIKTYSPYLKVFKTTTDDQFTFDNVDFK